MNKLNIYVQRGKNNRNNNVGVNISEESDKEQVREIILTIKEALKKRFPDIGINVRPSADEFLN